MKQIYNYIIEKLHLNKNINVKYFKEDDEVCFVSINQPGNYRREGCPIEIIIHHPFRIENFDEDKNILLYSIEDNKPNLELDNAKVNKYHFIEDNTDKYCRTIVLDKKSAVLFLKELYKSTKKITLEYLKNNYVEDIKTFDFKYWNNEIRFCTIIGSVVINLNRKIIQNLIEEYE